MANIRSNTNKKGTSVGLFVSNGHNFNMYDNLCYKEFPFMQNSTEIRQTFRVLDELFFFYVYIDYVVKIYDLA